MDQEKLISALKSREPAAIEELVHAYGERLIHSAILLCGNETDAQDLVQDTFVQAIGSVHRFRGQSSLYTWLQAILLNLTRHYHRSRNRLIYDEELANQKLDPVEQDSTRIDLEAAGSSLSQALARLSPAHREVVILRHFEHMKIHEIAGQLGLSKGTVKSRLHYAIAELQKLLPQELNLFGSCGTEKKDLESLNHVRP